MSEVNAYMNGYQPNKDVHYLEASLEAHKEALKKATRKGENLEKAMKEIIKANNGYLGNLDDIDEIAKKALEVEGVSL